MNNNEICMFMDVKLDTHDKRAASALRNWTRCQVKIEAIKCVPCFLRFSFQSIGDSAELLSVSVNVPGVSISLATSRTKQYSYGLFWTQNRRDCYIYFALETETACRRHMKWIKKSIKNLELYRQVFLEQRRLSRGPSGLGPLPTLPDAFDASILSARASRVSQIYEEIFDGSRISRASIASGIYEEMKPSLMLEVPPPPPLPAHRKRINTFECGQVCELPRCSTTPESELAKKKKYKTMLDNIFGVARQKRTNSVSEVPAKNGSQALALCENAAAGTPPKRASNMSKSQRNSFSSPDLSKLDFLDTFGESHIADLLDMCAGDSSDELDESGIEPVARNKLLAKINKQLSKADSLESLNVSEQLPNNFNFSACNTSTINLVGANGAVPHSNLFQKNKILVDDLTGYCVMAPIVKKSEKQQQCSASTSSGYSTGSYCSSTSSNEEQQAKTLIQAAPAALSTANESDIYEPMHGSSLNSTSIALPVNSDFADHLYENLLTVKAAQELEQPLAFGLSTSTPTESPMLPALPQKGTPKQTMAAQEQQQEDYYQTPRRSIISVDDKIPSYYPNSCDTLKSKRRSPSGDNTTVGLRHLVSAKLRRERKENVYISTPQQIIEQRATATATKTQKQAKKTAAHKISEGVYAVTHAHSSGKRPNSTSNNNNNHEHASNLSAELQEELLQLAMLQNIDFKFDDSQAQQQPAQQPAAVIPSIVQPALEQEYEHCYQAAEQATRLLQRYATLAKFGKSPQQHQLQLNQSDNIKAMTQSVATQQHLQPSGMKKFASLPRFKKIDFSPLKMRLNNVLQRNQQPPQ